MERKLIMKTKFFLIASVITAFGLVGCAQNQTVAQNDGDIGRVLASGKCDSDAFAARIRAKGCTLSKNDERRIANNAEYCKQLANRYQIVSMKGSGDVVVLDTSTCNRTKYEVDSSGIDQLKIIQDYAYMTSNDGQLYIYSSHSGDFFELLSNSGNSYSRANRSNVTDIKGGTGGTYVTSTHANGTVQEWDSDKINSMSSNRLRRLRFWTFGANGSVYND